MARQHRSTMTPHTEVHTDVWTGMYRESWGTIPTLESYSHPAKFSKNLIMAIVQHALDAGFVRAGDTVMDPFGGVALGGYACLRQGLHWVGLELEPRFIDMGKGCDCTGLSAAAWVQFYGRWSRVSHRQGHHWCPKCLAEAPQVTGTPLQHKRTFRTKPGAGKKGKTRTVVFAPLPFPDRRDGIRPPVRREQLGMLATQTTSYARGSGVIPGTKAHHYEGNTDRWARQGYGEAVLLQGDSRQLHTMLPQYAACCVASPPYSSTDAKPTALGSGTGTRADGDGAGRNKGDSHYPDSPGQLGQMPAYDLTLSSPPYAGSQQVDNRTTHPRALSSTWRKRFTTITDGESPGQLANLPPGDVSLTVSSPPYADGCTHTGGADPQPQHVQGGEVRHVAYGTAANNLGNMDASISSPPWENSTQGDERPFGGMAISEKRCERQQGGLFHGLYGSCDNQLGNTQGDTFWSAAALAIRGVWDVLKPGGHCIWVVKNYIRDSKEVDFTGDWARLNMHIGFEWLHWHQALLVEDHGTQRDLFGHDTVHATHRKSFFRRLHEAKHPHLAINYESVLCFRKPLTAAPMPPDEAWEQLPLVKVAISSPPYSDALTHGGQRHKDGCMQAQTHGVDAFAGGYGRTPGQLEGLPSGSVDCAISSPPYAGAGEVLGTHNGIDYGKVTSGGTRRTPAREASGLAYGTSHDNLGNMPASSCDRAVDSPPALRGMSPASERSRDA